MQNKDTTRKRITIIFLFITEVLAEHNLRLNLKETVKKIEPKVPQNHLNPFFRIYFYSFTPILLFSLIFIFAMNGLYLFMI